MKSMAVMASFTLLAGACSDDETEGAGGSTTATTVPATEPGTDVDTTEDANSGDDYSIGVGTTEFGEVLTDASGLALYAFDDDEGATVPTCVDGCAATWPPLLTSEDLPYVLAADVPDTVTIGTIARDNGTEQVTLNGRPAYVFNEDEAGTANHQGNAGKWWLIGADGELIRTT